MRSLKTLLDADWARLMAVSGRTPCARRFIDGFSPRFATVVLIRMAERLRARGWRRLAKVAGLLNFLVFGIEVASELEIGPGLVIPHSYGTVIGAATIGANVTIFHQVTLGAKEADFQFDPATRPRIGDDVVLSVGAKILGPVVVGSGAIVGANAVVLDDVPENSVAVGVPARIIEKASRSGSRT